MALVLQHERRKRDERPAIVAVSYGLDSNGYPSRVIHRNPSGCCIISSRIPPVKLPARVVPAYPVGTFKTGTLHRSR